MEDKRVDNWLITSCGSSCVVTIFSLFEILTHKPKDKKVKFILIDRFKEIYECI